LEDHKNLKHTHQVVQKAEECNATEDEAKNNLSLHVILMRLVPDSGGIHYFLISVPVRRRVSIICLVIFSSGCMRTRAHRVAVSAMMSAIIAPNVWQWPGSKCGERQGNFQQRDVSKQQKPFVV
jgi:hypothetical protein